MTTELKVKDLSGESACNFMLNCGDEDYRRWWPGTHLAFHTTKRLSGNVGNLVYFDEYVGKRRLKFEGIIVKYVPCEEIAWQLKKVVKLPAWLIMKFKEDNDGVIVSHTVKAGFEGRGRVLDPILRFYLVDRDFEKDLEEHVRIEFPRLAEILS